MTYMHRERDGNQVPDWTLWHASQELVTRQTANSEISLLQTRSHSTNLFCKQRRISKLVSFCCVKPILRFLLVSYIQMRTIIPEDCYRNYRLNAQADEQDLTLYRTVRRAHLLSGLTMPLCRHSSQCTTGHSPFLEKNCNHHRNTKTRKVDESFGRIQGVSNG